MRQKVLLVLLLIHAAFDLIGAKLNICSILASEIKQFAIAAMACVKKNLQAGLARSLEPCKNSMHGWQLPVVLPHGPQYISILVPD